MSAPNPNRPAYELTRWDSPTPPSPQLLERWFQREKLAPETLTLTLGHQTEEFVLDQAVVRVVTEGRCLCGLPGYGVVELGPGDAIEIGAVSAMISNLWERSRRNCSGPCVQIENRRIVSRFRD